ncbi:unnamed protein product [Taenia asiatica]|uniref:Uncharacterized protein n=1 Tax=Taenia asiatica TaxID=60517 RepID=A0A3P6QSB0_TAEAS|nr:unnamed protein product [Taenia asiatica]
MTRSINGRPVRAEIRHTKGPVRIALEEGMAVDGRSVVRSDGRPSVVFPGPFPLSVMTSGANARHIEAVPSSMVKLGLHTLFAM